MDDQTVIVEKASGVATVWLSRESTRNAFNEEMIHQLSSVLNELETDPSIRILVLRGKGKVFCAGADLKWMQKAVDYSHDENLKESQQLSVMLHQLYTITKPTIALVHGAAFGGGIGLLAACDFVLAFNDTKFSFSEVKIGLIPATISPYALKRMSESKARQLMLTGQVFMAVEAQQSGLVDFTGSMDAVEQKMEEITGLLLGSAPEAQRKTKQLINEVVNNWTLEEAIQKTAALIAEIRSTEEAQKGMRAFLSNRQK